MSDKSLHTVPILIVNLHQTASTLLKFQDHPQYQIYFPLQ